MVFSLAQDMVLGILRHFSSKVSQIVLEIPIEERLAVSSENVRSVCVWGLRPDSWALFFSGGTIVILSRTFFYCPYITGRFNTPATHVPLLDSTYTPFFPLDPLSL